MSTAADLIRRSMKLLGELAAGEPMGAEDQADGLVELNLLLGSWANERLLVHGVRRSTYTLTPSLSPHTIGVGGTFNTTRPLRIDGAGIIPSGSTAETKLTVLTDGQYQETGSKAATSAVPASVWVEWTHPTAKLWLYPVPTTAATLVLYTWSRVAAFATSDTIALPDGYENALAHALALQWAPMFGAEPSGTLRENAADAKAAIKRTNSQTPIVQMDLGVSRGGIFNIDTGEIG